MKPEITGCERKFAIKPSLRSPMNVSIIPDIRAKMIANAMYSELPGFANWLQDAEVINAITATGPTASVLDVHDLRVGQYCMSKFREAKVFEA